MKKLLLITALLSQPVFAWDNPAITEPYLSSDEGYTSSTGNKYQYDMSRPVDRIKYDIDIKAQMRDELSISPTREIDRDLGQYGAGIYE